MSDSAASTQPASPRRTVQLVYLVLAAAVILIYSRVFRCDFIDWDDPTHVTGNPCVLAGLGLRSIAWAFSHFIASQWIPLTWVSHMLDVSLFGLDPRWHHLGNVVLHAANACLVLAVLHQLTREFWPSVVVAALFAVHPINVESVAWIAERKNVLSTFFWLLAMAAYTRHAAQPRGRWMWAVAGCMALGLMAKPMLVTLPCALLLLDVWPLRRAPAESWPRLVGEKTVLFLLSAASCATTLAAAAHDHQLTGSAMLPLRERLANAAIGYVAYLGNLVCPTRLAVLYPIEATHAPAQVMGSLTLLLLLTAIFIVLRKRFPFLLVGWLWFLGILVPVSSIFQVGSQAYADRFAYIPELGIFWAVVWTARTFPRPAVRWQFAAATAVIALLASVTLTQVGYWTDSVTLFERTLVVTPPNGVAHSLAGMGWVRRGDYPHAIAHYREAERLMPRTAEIHSLLAEALTHTGANEEALHELRAAVALDPTDAHARRNLITLLVNQGHMAEARKLLPH